MLQVRDADAPALHVAADKPSQNTSAMDSPNDSAPRSWRRIFDTLRFKTLLMIGATLVVLMCLLYVVVSTIALTGFVQLEEQRVHEDIERVVNAFEDDLTRMRTQTLDYAIWDDTYAFMQDQDPSYIENNLYDQLFVDMKLNLMLFVDPAGHLVYSKAFDLDQQHAVPLPADIATHLTPQSPLLHEHTLRAATIGIVMLDQGPLLVAAAPIGPSSGAGVTRGTLIWGRFLTTAKVRDLSALTALSLDVRPFDDPRLPADFQAIRDRLAPATPIVVRPLNESQIGGYAVLYDLQSQPAVLVRVDEPREIYARGRAVSSYLGLALLVVGVVFGGVTLLVLEQTILSRLVQFSRNVSSIGASGDLALRMSFRGNDELARLAGAINRMLAALEHAQHEREQSVAERARIDEDQRIVQAKREFVATIAHDLRTPLTPIKGYVDLLNQFPMLPAHERREYLDVIQRNVGYMASLIEDVLELGRLEAHMMELHVAPVNLATTMAWVADLLQPFVAEKQLSLSVAIEDTVPEIEADEKRLGQVLINLVTNAIKYTNAGGAIRIEVARQSEQCIEVQVIDTGIGLTPEQQSQVFTRFYRADNVLRDQVAGTGLGLMIVKFWIELHGGTMSVWSEEHVGSVFAFTLPIRQPRQIRDSADIGIVATR